MKPAMEAADTQELSPQELMRLSGLLRHALLEIRHLCRQGKAERAGALADAVHNLPTAMWRDDFDRGRLLQDLDAYRCRCEDAGTAPLFEYAALLDGRADA